MTDSAHQFAEPTSAASQPSNAEAKKPALHPMLIVSGILTAVVGVIALFELSGLPASFEWALAGEADLLIRPWAYILADVLAPVLAFGAAYIALAKRDLRRHASAVTAAYLVPGAIYTIVEVIRFLFVLWPFTSSPVVEDIPYLLRNFVPFINGNQSFEHDFRLILLIINLALAWILVSVSKSLQANKSVTNQFGGTTHMSNQQPVGYDPQTGAPIFGQPVQAQPIGYDPRTGAPIYGQPGYMRPESPLPLIALLGGIFFPLLGIIVGHIALSQMKRGEIPSSNMGLAKTGLILGYVFTALGIIAVAIYAVLMAMLASSIYYY